MNKLCNTCGVVKPVDEFHKRKASTDGLSSKCKGCQLIYDKSRKDCPKRKEKRREYANGKGKAVSNESKRRYIERNPKIRSVHNIVSNALRDGYLRKKVCEVCGLSNVHAHHDDYNKPLNVRWLCPIHHRSWHEQNGPGANRH